MGLNGFSSQHQMVTVLGGQSPAWSRSLSFQMYMPLVHCHELFIRIFMKYFGPNGLKEKVSERNRERERQKSKTRRQ